MRTEQEVLTQLLDFAKSDNRIRAVIMNGSRVNPNVRRDLFQDYDIVLAVTDPHSFITDQSWLEPFGEVVIMQQNDIFESGLSWPILMVIFSDNIRLDLQFFPIKRIEHKYQDSLSQLLLDKDGTIRPFPPSNDYAYHTKKPSAECFEKTINEFFWVATYVGKGIWRDELSYAQYLYHNIIVKALSDVIAWWIGYDHDWQINSGKLGKWYRNFLEPQIWHRFEKVYDTATYPDLWASLFRALELMNELGPILAQRLDYQYPHKDAKMVKTYLQRIVELPAGVSDFGPDIISG